VHEAVADLARREKMNAKTNDSNDSNERETDKTDKIAAFVTCVGGGGLLMGILQGLRETGLDAAATRVVAAETLGADSMASSLEAGAVVTLPGITSVAKSLGAAAPSARVFAEAHELYRDERDRRVLPLRVSDEDAVRACLRFADDHRVLVEPACGAALAAVYGGQAANWLEKCADGPVVVEVCGGAIVDRGILQAYAKQFGIE
jgi:L-serine/L-threonine ammonia-lyase